MMKTLKKAALVGLKLFGVGIIAALPYILISMFTLWIPMIGWILLLPLLVLEIITFGWLVLKWRKWIFE